VPRAGSGAAHYLAPAAFLLAVTIAVLLIRSGLERGSTPATTARPVATQRASVAERRGRTKHVARYYTVRSGDTFGSIAANTGVSIARLEQLNPGVSSNALQVGQRVRVK
jgi:Tfp pilus assembly protein FimV